MANEGSPTARVDRWEAASEWPLAALAFAFLVAYAAPILRPSIPHTVKRVCEVVDLVAWVAFAIDYAVRIILARHRARYALRHWADLLVVALPILRPLRLLRLVMLLRIFNRQATRSLRGRVIVYVAAATALLIFVAALAELDAERGRHGANIETFGDALWWAFVTISTVGYGDRYPVTLQGRGIAVGLMIGGVALIGIITATFASWLVDQVRASEEQIEAATRADVAALTVEVQRLREVVERNALGAPSVADADSAVP